MRTTILYLAVVMALVAVVGASACDSDSREVVPFKEPPSGVLLEEELLIVDCGIPIKSEKAAVNLASERLQEISAANLIRIPGDINKQTLLKMHAQEFERYVEPAFLVYIDYRAESGSGYDVGILVVEVTKDGKIYGSSPVVEE